MPLAVVAIGGNSLTRERQVGTIDQQFANARRTAAPIATLIEKGWNVVLTHGNGPQVGNVLERVEAAAPRIYRLPIDVCVADTEGGIGYMLQQVLANELRRRGIERSVVTLITQTKVDPLDPAFGNPDKPIGPFFGEPEAKERQKKLKWVLKEDAGRGWRRVVASPWPLAILEVDAIAHCVRHGMLVIAAGGGGVPVVERSPGQYEGVEAVVDKDRASALLAHQLGADLFLISTAVPAVQIGYRTRSARELGAIDAAELRGYYDAGQFAAGSMAPKIQAALAFVEAGPTSRRSIITDPEHLLAALAGEAGTRVTARVPPASG